MDVYDAAERYQQENVQLVLLVGKDYGSGSSRDWAAKGPYLQVGFYYRIFLCVLFLAFSPR
jgi:aconitase A